MESQSQKLRGRGFRFLFESDFAKCCQMEFKSFWPKQDY